MGRKKKIKDDTPKKVGRPRVNLELHEARELVRGEGLTSVVQYKKWWQLNTPARIPKRPDRAYKNEWISWNDFLGSNNEFHFIRKTFRPFIEARSFAQQLGLGTKAEWIAYAKSGKKPEDIPSRPDLIYTKDWFTWKDFVGADIPSIKRNINASPAVFFIIQNSGRPNNVFQFGITLEGVKTVLQYQAQQQFKIVGLYHCDIDFAWQRYAEHFGKLYWESGRSDEYVISNINDYIFEISDNVVPVRST